MAPLAGDASERRKPVKCEELISCNPSLTTELHVCMINNTSVSCMIARAVCGHLLLGHRRQELLPRK